jgi:MoxR-like ATPase
MATTTVNMQTTVTLSQAAAMICAVPDNIFYLKGEPGIGKSSLIDFIKGKLPDHIVATPIDVPNLDLGDAAMPVVDKEKMLTNYAPNARFQLTCGKPVVLCLDEFTKGADPVKNMLHPLFEASNRRLGDVLLHPGSIVFLTGNLGSDGVGDSLKAHSKQRLCQLHVRKPDAEEWLLWAASGVKNIDPSVMAWVNAYPHCLASYLDGDQNDNLYIFNPKRAGQEACVSPRTLERASNIVRAREAFDSGALIAGLAGTIGESAARDMEAFIAYQDDIPSWDAMVKDPKGTRVPADPGACSVLIYRAVTKVTKETISPFMTYLERFESEWQAAFAINVAKNPAKQAIAFSSPAFAKWVLENEDLL